MANREDILPHFTVPTPWDHQIRGVLDTVNALQHEDAVTLCSPTGGGKTQCTNALINYYISQGKKVKLFTNRKLLTTQTIEGLKRNGIEFGVRAAQFPDLYDPTKPVQLSSIQTELSRVYDIGCWERFDSDITITDEAHLQATGSCERVLRDDLEHGGKIIGVTATPLEMSHLYPKLILAGSNSEMRRCGAHVPAIIKCAPEFDLSKVRRVKTGEYVVGDIRKEIWSQQVVASIFDAYVQFNPDRRQAIGFAPGVPESIGLCELFNSRGVKAAHIDGEVVVVDGKQYTDSSGAIRKETLERWNAGEIKYLWNRYVFREGLDFPSIYFLQLATPIGTLKGYIQTVGRALRRSEQTPDHVMICDHGGSVIRHGSPNKDWDWESLYYLDGKQIKEEVEKQQQKEKEEKQVEPIVCPHCSLLRNGGVYCPAPPVGCGQRSTKSARKVIQSSGRLVDYVEPKRKKVNTLSVEQKNWDGIYYACKNSRSSRASTFGQAMAMYKKQFGEYPPSGLLRMPISPADNSRRIKDVHPRELRQSWPE